MRTLNQILGDVIERAINVVHIHYCYFLFFVFFFVFSKTAEIMFPDLISLKLKKTTIENGKYYRKLRGRFMHVDKFWKFFPSFTNLCFFFFSFFLSKLLSGFL